MCFVCISEQTAIISLYNINWLVCITETECVYCAVRTVVHSKCTDLCTPCSSIRRPRSTSVATVSVSVQLWHRNNVTTDCVQCGCALVCGNLWTNRTPWHMSLLHSRQQCTAVRERVTGGTAMAERGRKTGIERRNQEERRRTDSVTLRCARAAIFAMDNQYYIF